MISHKEFTEHINGLFAKRDKDKILEILGNPIESTMINKHEELIKTDKGYEFSLHVDYKDKFSVKDIQFPWT